EDGKLKLDESIRTYLPDSPATWAPITPRHLLRHTSGLSRTPAFDLRKDYTDDELFQIFYTSKLEFVPGERMSYSNTGYALLGLLVKKVGGEFYGDVLKKRVFGPLGMHTASVIDDRNVVPNRAAGYQLDANGKVVHHDWVAPTGNSTGDGALQLTILDFAKWEAGVNARKILKPESWAAVFEPARLNSGKTYPYGFGWFLDRVAGHESQHHSGGWQGFTTDYARFLETNTAVVVLQNFRGSSPTEVLKAAAGFYNAKLVAPPGAPISDRDPKVTQRLKQIVAENQIPAKEQALFDSPGLLERTLAPYQKARAPLGKLQELRLFDYEAVGDDQLYRYRGRFAAGVADVTFMLTPSGKIARLIVRPVESWTTTVF
ncbi:serine hydrolase domain-containing protein, partial [Steroidobacter sp.]|uniref:serine hydrolase domain-containing protein n=1 Tax=Steroidobacter sp. TaxID=1978227 RepID=UPI001A5707A7